MQHITVILRLRGYEFLPSFKGESMGKPLTVSTKLLILLGLAVLFGATLVALSSRSPQSSIQDDRYNGGDRLDQTFTVSKGGKLMVLTDIGDLSIAGTDSDQVQIQVMMKGDSEVLDRFKVDFSQDGNTVFVRGDYRNHGLRFFDDQWFDIKFKIYVPRNFNLDLQTSGGEIVVHTIEGKIIGETSGGDVAINNTRGTMRMTTSGGNMDLKKVDGEIFAETSGGDIQVGGATGSIRVETSGGNIHLRDSDGSLYASTSGGNIRVSLKDNKGIDLSTSGGNIIIDLPQGISADVDAESTGGEVSCDFAFSGKLREGSLHGKINGGGNLIKAETSGGDISINAVE